MAGLTPPDVKFQAALIRYARGMLNAWEEWMFSRSESNKVEENGDVQTHVAAIQSQTRRNEAPHS